MTTILSSLLLNCLTRTLGTPYAQSYLFTIWQQCLCLRTGNLWVFSVLSLTKVGTGNGRMDQFYRTPPLGACHIVLFCMYSKYKRATTWALSLMALTVVAIRTTEVLRWIDQPKQRMCYKPRKQKVDFSGGRRRIHLHMKNLIHNEKGHYINNVREEMKNMYF